jgi:hypothetical protein
MKKLLEKLLKIDKLRKEVEDLRTTCANLSIEVTKVHTMNSDAVKTLTAFNLTDSTKPWWDDVNTSNLNSEQFRLACNIQRKAKIDFVDKFPSLKDKQVFHGGCMGCIRPETYGIGDCRGCQYLNADWSLPNKHLKTVDGKS